MFVSDIAESERAEKLVSDASKANSPQPIRNRRGHVGDEGGRRYGPSRCYPCDQLDAHVVRCEEADAQWARSGSAFEQLSAEGAAALDICLDVGRAGAPALTRVRLRERRLAGHHAETTVDKAAASTSPRALGLRSKPPAR